MLGCILVWEGFVARSVRMGARRNFRLGHDGLPLAFGSLCARLAAVQFAINADANADDPCENPAARPSCLNVL